MILSDETYEKMADEYAKIPEIGESLKAIYERAVMRKAPFTLKDARDDTLEEQKELLFQIYCIDKEIFEKISALYPHHPIAAQLVRLKEHNLAHINVLMRAVGEDVCKCGRKPKFSDVTWKQGQCEAYFMSEKLAELSDSPLAYIILINEGLASALTH
ncbi:MAG: hypothetical protein ACI4S9_07030 [Christensenellales bacterium]